MLKASSATVLLAVSLLLAGVAVAQDVDGMNEADVRALAKAQARQLEALREQVREGNERIRELTAQLEAVHPDVAEAPQTQPVPVDNADGDLPLPGGTVNFPGQILHSIPLNMRPNLNGV